jgi:RimJ/RimL family protein N-acetyltransferase
MTVQHVLHAPSSAPIHGARLILRPLEAGDAALLQRFSADPRVAEGTRSIQHPLPPTQAEGFIAAQTLPARDRDVWAMDATKAGLGRLVGVISLKPLDRGQSQIGYWVAPEFWNTGLASEAVRLVIESNPHQSRTLFAEVFQDNPASARVLTNAGFDYISDAEAYSAARAQLVPTWTYLRRM